MVMTMLSRTVARGTAIGRVAGTATTARFAVPALPACRALHTSVARHGDYDYNMGVPGSRIRNPAPEQYDDVYPGMGRGWWALVTTAFLSFFWTQWYDTSRGVNVVIGIFGPNMPM
eukprot:TRINITY_DN13131_c0_g1_i1.p1 TRINITY_DN13131_c0_g1~~TRINITY_DN13131_c0_g1_i1.p1  ORF type:complete len:116 (-),score=16.65 TRINITY_DN13131_c0_g1_i1:100-447(-)